MSAEPPRWILHLDMDAFFASVEQLDDPNLRGKPVIIGGGKRGVVSTASYEARRFGVRSAMPIFQAKKLCPGGVFIPGRMARYREKSREVMSLLDHYSPLVEKASVDEAYLDLTGLERLFGEVRDLARALQKEVREKTGLGCSVGLAPVKFLAKIASDMRKPSGLTVIAHEEVQDFLKSLPVGKIPGVGPSMLKSLELLGIRHASDVRRFDGEFWEKRLGKPGQTLYERCLGIDPRPVTPYSAPKSESAENTFAADTLDKKLLSTWLLRQSERVGKSLREQRLVGRTITLKIKYADFTQKTRSRTLKEPTNGTRTIYEAALALLEECKLERPLRLIGVGVSQFGAPPRQLSLFPEEPGGGALRAEKDAALDAALDLLRGKFGREAVVRGKLFKAGQENPNAKPARPEEEEAEGWEDDQA